MLTSPSITKKSPEWKEKMFMTFSRTVQGCLVDFNRELDDGFRGCLRNDLRSSFETSL